MILGQMIYFQLFGNDWNINFLGFCYTKQTVAIIVGDWW